MIYMVFGLLISIIVDRFSGPTVSHIRRRAFSKQRTKEYQQHENELLNMNSPASRFTGAYAGLGEISRPLHEAAIEKQNQYQEALLTMTCLLFFSLFALAWTAAFSKPVELKITLVWTELFCLLLLLKKYLGSRRLITKWVSARAAAELVREARFLNALSYKAWPSEEQQNAKLRGFAEEVSKDLNSAKTQKELLETISLYSNRILTEFQSKVDQLTIGDATTYLHRRIGRQLNWFRASAQRLHLEVERGAVLALIVFGVTLLLAFVKALLVSNMINMGQNYVNVVTFLLLVSAASSAALVYHSTGRGTGTLSLRYSTQADRIESLLDDFKADLGVNLESNLSAENQGQFQSLVKRFEELGNDELLEWVLVTERHSAELG